MSGYDSALVGLEQLEHPDLLALARGTRLLAIEGLVWSCARHTDGVIPRGALRRLTDEEDPEVAAAALVAVGQWTVIEIGWRITHFLVHQDSADQIHRKREQQRAYSARYRDKIAARAANGAGEPSRQDSLPASRQPPRTTDRPTDPKGGGRRKESADGSRGARPEGAPALPPRPGRISTADTETLAGIHDGRLCSCCTLPFLEGGVRDVKVGAGGRYSHLMAHEGVCPMLPESISDDGEFRRGWSMCDICGSQMPEVLVTPADDAGNRFCLDHDARGCGGQALEAVRLGDVTPQAVEPVPDAPALEELATSPVPYIAKAATRAIADRTPEPKARVVWCADFRAHQTAHRRLGDGWICDVCVASAVAI